LSLPSSVQINKTPTKSVYKGFFRYNPAQEFSNAHVAWEAFNKLTTRLFDDKDDDELAREVCRGKKGTVTVVWWIWFLYRTWPQKERLDQIRPILASLKDAVALRLVSPTTIF